MAKRDIVVVGASAGGVTTLQNLLAALPADLPASLFVVQHLAFDSPGYLPKILDQASRLSVVKAVDGLPHRHGHVYVAPADDHLVLKQPGIISLSHGPRENRHRPAIDTLFRSAARTYGPRAVAILLTGTLDDGAMGLTAVKMRGGVAVVQDPADALFPEMPQNAINFVEGIDCIVPVAAMPELLLELVQQEVQTEMSRNDEPGFHPDTGNDLEPADMRNRVLAGNASGFICPECGGALWEADQGQVLSYTCHVGHRYGPQALMAEHEETVESALWAALRALVEQAALARHLAEQYRNRPTLANLSAEYLAQAEAAEEHARTLRDVVLKQVSSVR